MGTEYRIRFQHAGGSNLIQARISHQTASSDGG
jgi:hypothetical protein